MPVDAYHWKILKTRLVFFNFLHELFEMFLQQIVSQLSMGANLIEVIISNYLMRI
jgi:hypothetical protein